MPRCFLPRDMRSRVLRTRLSPKKMTCFAVGEATAEAAKKLGFFVISSAGAAQDLILLVQKTGAAGPLIHPHGQHSRGQIAATLTKKGIPALNA